MPRASASIEPPSVPSHGVQPDSVHRTIVLIADDLALAAEDVPAAKKAMKNFVDREMQPGDLISVMTTSGGMGITAQLTNDRRQIDATIDRIHWSTGRTGLTWYQPVHDIDAATKYENESNARLDANRKPFLTAVGTLATIAYAIDGLREMPGRKAIALLSDGFLESPAKIVELANRASVTVYTLDPRGVPAFNLSAVDNCACGKNPLAVDAHETQRKRDYRATQQGLEQLARGTGGIFFHDDNDLTEGMVSAMADMDGYYLLGYQPHREAFEAIRGKLQFHKLEIKILRPGLQVRSRNGFVGTPDSSVQGSRQPSGRDALRNALLSPFQANGFPVRLSAFYSASRDRQPVLRAMLAIDAHELHFKDAPDGKKQLGLDIVAAAYDGAKPVASSDKTFSTELTESEVNQLIASGLVYNMDIAIPKPGGYQFRVAIRDANSEQIGSATTFVEIPDFNRRAMELSSILLSDSDAARNEGLARAGVLGPGSPVTRAFGSGAAVTWDCDVFGAAGNPQIEMSINLFRGRESIFTGHPISAPAGKKGAPVHLNGQVKLPDSLPAGDYALELLVHDGGKSATQWTDFVIVK
jgi:VWFA-related protein